MALALLLLVYALAGCSSAGPFVPGGQGTASASAERFKLTIIANLHTAEVPSDQIEKLLEEQTGTELDIQWIPDGSYDERINASLTTGTLPKALYLKNAASLPMFRDEMRNGLFWEIGPLLDQYENLRRLKPEVLRNTMVEGKLYGLYQERPFSRQGIIYRKDWADRLGLEAPGTIDELYEMIRQFTYGDPDNNGIRDTFGLADRGDLIYGAFKTVASYFGTPNGWGEMDGQLLPEFMFPQYMETLKFFRRLHEEGLMNQDFPVTSKADQQDFLISGRAGVYIGAMIDVLPLESKLKTSYGQAELDVHNRIAGPEGYRVWSGEGYGTVLLFPKSSIRDEVELMQVLAFFDRLMSPEIANLIYWGIEGTHYTVSDGRAVPSSDIPMTDKDVKPYQALMVGGRTTIPGLLDSDYMLAARDKAEVLTKDNDKFLVFDPTASLDSPTFNEKGTRLSEIMKDASYKFMLGMIDEAAYQAEVERWQLEGGDRIIEEFNDAYNRQH